VDGFELIRYIRQLPADKGGMVPAIALSGWISLDTHTLALNSGFQAFIEKPYDPMNLLEAVSKLTGWNLVQPELVA
jgi:CheY-like chemotaxis protein